MPVGIDIARGRDGGLLAAMGARGLAVIPALRRIATLMRQRERRVFASGGFGAWAALDPDTLASKRGGRILVDTGGLLDSLTQRGARYAVTRASSDLLVFGTSHPVAHLLRDGARGTPKRDPVPTVRAGEVEEWADELLTHITGRPL